MSTILVVEDNPDNMDLIKEILEDAAYDMFCTESAENALDVLKQGIHIDLILMDVSLPNLNGYDATRIIKQDPRSAHIPVIMLTAHAMREDKEKGFEAGCQDFLTKPLDEDLLLKTVGQYLTGSN